MSKPDVLTLYISTKDVVCVRYSGEIYKRVCSLISSLTINWMQIPSVNIQTNKSVFLLGGAKTISSQ